MGGLWSKKILVAMEIKKKWYLRCTLDQYNNNKEMCLYGIQYHVVTFQK